MTTFGVLPEGFRRMTLEDLLNAFETDQLADISADLDVSTESIPGQFNGIYGRQLAIGWEVLEILYHSNDPEAAEGRLLEMLCKLTGTFRVGDTFGTVVLSCDLDIGTTLIAGTHFAALEDSPDVRWTPVESFTATVAGANLITFVAEQGGPVPGAAGDINNIATPLVGWNSVVNPDDAALGVRVETDPLLREHREKELALIGSTAVRAITADILAAFPKLESLIVFENDGDSVDGNGLPPHSIEALIYDGTVPTVDNDELAQVIFDGKAAGIQTHGGITASAKALVNGVETTKAVKFSRATQVGMYIEYDLVTGSGYVGDAAVALYVATECNRRFGPGKPVIASVLASLPLQLAGVEDVTGVRLGNAPSPVGTANWPITARQIARFDTSRISF